MKEFIKYKLKSLLETIEKDKERILSYVEKGEYDNLKNCEILLKFNKDNWRNFSKDACMWLSIDDVIELLEAKLIDMYSAEMYFKYTRKLSYDEVQQLSKFSYRFRNLPVKP